MKKLRLLENDILFYKTISTIFFLLFISIITYFIKPKFLKFNTLDVEILVSGILTFFIEILIIFYLFFSFPVYFKSLFKKNINGFFKGVLFYFAIIPVLFILVFLSFYIFKKFGIQPIPQNVILAYFKIKSFPVFVFIFFLSSIFAPVFEEVFFRGFLYTALKEKFSIPFSIFASSLIFSLFHGEIYVFIGIFSLGLILTYIFEKTENLWICIGLHFSNNFFANLVIFVLKYKKFNYF